MIAAVRIYSAFFCAAVSIAAGPIHDAVKKGDVEAVRRILAEDKGAITSVGNEKATPLEMAAAEGKAEVVRVLLEAGADVNTKNNFGTTPLHYSVANTDNPEVCKLLIEAGASLTATNFEGKTPLVMAVSEARVKAAKVLMERGADVRYVEQNGATVLHWAAIGGSEELVRLLLDRGLEVDAEDKGGQTALLVACGSGRLATAKVLIERGADVRHRARNGLTALFTAIAAKSDPAVGLMLLARGADPNARTDAGSSPILVAALSEKQVAVTRALIGAGANVNVVDPFGFSPLIIAAGAGAIETTRLLLDAGADIEARAQNGFGALATAADHGFPDIVELLAKRGANTASVDGWGTTPIYLAAQAEFRPETEYQKVVRVLKAAKVEINSRGPRRETPLFRAVAKKHFVVAEELLRAGGDANIPDANSFFPLHVAVGVGSASMVKALIAAGAEVNQRAGDGSTALGMAMQASNTEIAKILSSAGAKVEGLSESELVGVLEDPERIEFTGNKTFSAQQLRNALDVYPQYALRRHPKEPRAALVKVIRDALALGYLNSGFPDSKVEVAFVPGEEKIRANIVEGARVKCGELRVDAPAGFPSARLVAKLSEAPNSFWQRFASVGDDGKIRPHPADGLLVKPQEAFWIPGAPMSFIDTHFMEEAIRALYLLELGYPDATVSIERVRRLGGAVGDFVLHIAKARRAVSGELEVQGAKINSREDIVKLLGLKTASDWADEDLDVLRKRVFESGRIHDFALWARRTGKEQPEAQLVFQCYEWDTLPPVSRALRREEAAILKAGETFQSEFREGSDVVVNTRFTTNGIVLKHRLIFSKDGFAAADADSKTGFLMASNFVGGIFQSNRSVSVSTTGEWRLGIGMEIVPERPRDGESARGFNWSFEFRTRRAGESTFGSVVQLYPSVVLETFNDRGAKLTWDNDVLTCVASNGVTSARIDSKTGRLIDFEFNSGGTNRVAITLEKNALAQEARRFRAATTPGATNELASNLARLLILSLDASRQQALVTNAFPNLRLPSSEFFTALDKVIQKGALRSLDGMADSMRTIDPTDGFNIPVDPNSDDVAPKSIMATLTSYVSRAARASLPANSWPIVLLREGGALQAGRSRYAAEEFERLRKSPELGPIAMLTVASFLNQSGFYGADNFATEGFKRLDFASFEKDWKFLTSTPLFQTFADDLKKAADTLSDAERKALVEGMPADLGHIFFEGSRSVDDLKRAWTSSLAAGVEHGLRTNLFLGEQRLPSRLLGERMKAAYQAGDFKNAFRYAEIGALRKEPNAAFVLASFYEDGKGTKRDRQLAAQYYEIAARAGITEAQVKLGELLSDSFTGKPDYERAFVWLVLAERRGNKTATALKMSVQRRLTPDRLVALEPMLLELEKKLISPPATER